jgi:CheY-like chemotaxis protein
MTSGFSGGRTSCRAISGCGSGRDELSKVDIPRGASGAVIVVVDDEVLVTILASAILSVAGFTSETLTSGEEAVERRFQDPVPAVIVLNWLMPGMNGDEAIRLIREREAAEGLPRMPIVFESGDIVASDVRRADADLLLAKPFTADQLVEAVIQAGWPRTPGSVGGSNGRA